MTVDTASRPGTRADEKPAGDRGGTRPGGHDRGRPRDHGEVQPGDRGPGPPGDHDQEKPRKHDQLWYTVLALGIAMAAFLAAWGLHGNSSSTYRISSNWGAFTGLFILALAIERALEPFSRRLGPDTTKAKNDRDMDLARARADDKAMVAAEHKLAVDKCRRLTAVVTWGVATGLAFVLCSVLNITLMQAVRTGGSGAPPFWADLLVTGLVVGAGTQPLHDLVSNIERVKEGRSANGDGAG